MKKLICVLTLALAFALSLQANPQNDNAESIIEQYLKMPHPEDDTLGDAREARWEVLGQLKTMPETAVSAIARILPELTNQKQRRELTGVLTSHFQTPESAKVLCKLLEDQDRQVRWEAIHALRMMSRCTDRSGNKRDIRKAHLEPKVDGLVPYLIAAAADKAAENRIGALYALADTRDPSAVAEIRNRLNDENEKVRFFAACFLTEYQDASGLPELRGALHRLHEKGEADSFTYYRDAGMLLASLERLLGKSFGPIPMNPNLSSHFGHMEAAKLRHRELIDTWSQWWAWQPAK
jgi:HEAT repeat protein